MFLLEHTRCVTTMQTWLMLCVMSNMHDFMYNSIYRFARLDGTHVDIDSVIPEFVARMAAIFEKLTANTTHEDLKSIQTSAPILLNKLGVNYPVAELVRRAGRIIYLGI